MFGEDEAKEMLEKGPVFIELSDCGLTIDNKKPCIETDRDELDECQMLLYFPKQVDNITFEIILQFVFNRKMGK